jgi:hypothetical protein
MLKLLSITLIVWSGAIRSGRCNFPSILVTVYGAGPDFQGGLSGLYTFFCCCCWLKEWAICPLKWNSRTSIWPKTWVFCSMLFTVFLLFGFLKKTRLYSVLKMDTKKSAKQENSSLFVNRILQKGKNDVRKPDKNSSLRRLEFMPRNLN